MMIVMNDLIDSMKNRFVLVLIELNEKIFLENDFEKKMEKKKKLNKKKKKSIELK